jgi:hypothetical protein
MLAGDAESTEFSTQLDPVIATAVLLRAAIGHCYS